MENKVLHSPLHRPLHWAYMGFYTGRYTAPYIGPCIGPCIGAGRHGEFLIHALPQPTRCCSHVLLQPEENADVAVVRFRGPLVQGVGLFEQNAIRNTEMPFGTAIGVVPGQNHYRSTDSD